MRARCDYAKSQRTYRHYGGKGIAVCVQWQEFLPFYYWALESGYQDNLVIDRIRPDKGYQPENCQWITQAENARRLIKHGPQRPVINSAGQTFASQHEAARSLGILQSSIANALKKGGRCKKLYWKFASC